MELPKNNGNLIFHALAAVIYNTAGLVLMLTNPDRIFFYSTFLLAVAGLHLIFLISFAILGMLRRKNLVNLSWILITVFVLDFLTWVLIFNIF